MKKRKSTLSKRVFFKMTLVPSAHINVGVLWQEMLNDNGIAPPVLDLFFLCFAYVKWKIDDSVGAADRTYANEKRRRPPLGFRRQVESKETTLTSHTAGKQWFHWKLSVDVVWWTGIVMFFGFFFFFFCASPHTYIYFRTGLKCWEILSGATEFIWHK